MAYKSSGLLLFALLVSIVSALQSRQIDVYAWPVSDTTSQLLASIEYNSTTAIVKKSLAPKLLPEEDVVRVGFYHPESQRWTGIVTVASNLEDTKEKTIVLRLDSDGVAYHVGLKAVNNVVAQKGAVHTDLMAEVVPLPPAPSVHLNKPVVLAADGQIEAPPEKSFLQKYWWVLAGFLVLQVFMSGGSDKKE